MRTAIRHKLLSSRIKSRKKWTFMALTYAFWLFYNTHSRYKLYLNLFPPYSIATAHPWSPSGRVVDLDMLVEQLKRYIEDEDWQVLGSRTESESVAEEYLNPSSEKAAADIAFFLQISPSNLVLVPRLMRKIWHPRNVYCLHIDRKVQDEAVTMFTSALHKAKLSNTYMLSSSSVTYAGISMVVNTLDAMHSLLLQNKTWDYFINLSGSDYPLVSATAIRYFLGVPDVMNRQVNFIHYAHNMSSWTKLAAHRLGSLHFDPGLYFNLNHSTTLIETQYANPILDGKDVKNGIAKGEAWMIAHRSFCEQAAHGNAGRRLLALFATMQSSSEHFFQTLAWNSAELNRTLTRHSFREVVWSKNGKKAIQHPFYLDEQESNSSWAFWGNIARSPNFFARKFRVPDSSLMDHIDFVKSGATVHGFNISSVLENLRFVKRTLACAVNLDKRHKEEKIMPCLGGRWKRRNCKESPSICSGNLPDPPA